LKPATAPETLIEALSILSILISRFPAHLASSCASQPPLKILAPLLAHPRTVVRKRAITTISQFISVSSPQLFSELLEVHVFYYLQEGNSNTDRQRTTVQLVAALARNSSKHISQVLPAVVPGILRTVQRDDPDLREGSLQVK
jgi:cullin-associated NEDD8-dissociated protein 1